MQERLRQGLLIIMPGIPFPPINGYKLKIYNLIKILAEKYDLHLITIDKKQLSAEQSNFINAHSYKSKHFVIHTFSTILTIGFSIFKKIPFQVAYFTIPSVKEYLRNETKNDKVAFLNLVRVGEYLPLLEEKKIIFDMVDALSISYLRSRKNTTSFLYKFIYKTEAKRLLNYEKNIIQKSDLTLCVNPFDSKHFNKYGKTVWLPNGVKDDLLSYDKYDNHYKDTITFFGTMDYQPNIDSVMWFVNNVLPHIERSITLYIIGTNPSPQIKELGKKNTNIVITGFLNDPYIILNSSLCAVAPMQNGGGIQNKILEVMALGKINVLTTYGAMPIKQAHNGQHFLIADDPLQMAKIINDIYFNKEKYVNIGLNAKQLIQQYYTWKNYELNLLKELKDAVE